MSEEEKPHQELMYGGARASGKRYMEDAIKLAYERGRADERKRLLWGEPDGWCAWHPEKGWFKVRDVVYLSSPYMGDLSGGYKMKPVKLVVLDE